MENYEILDTALSNPLKYVLYFRDIENNILYDKPHYYIILPTKTNEFIFLTMITSQIDKVKSRVENKETLIELNKNDLDFLTKDISIIDCNRIIMKSKEDLFHLETLKIINTNISKELYEKLVIAINKSKVISTRYKKHIDLSKLK